MVCCCQFCNLHDNGVVPGVLECVRLCALGLGEALRAALPRNMQRRHCRTIADEERMQVLNGVFSMHIWLNTGMLLWSAALPVRHISND